MVLLSYSLAILVFEYDRCGAGRSPLCPLSALALLLQTVHVRWWVLEVLVVPLMHQLLRLIAVLCIAGGEDVWAQVGTVPLKLRRFIRVIIPCSQLIKSLEQYCLCISRSALKNTFSIHIRVAQLCSPMAVLASLNRFS